VDQLVLLQPGDVLFVLAQPLGVHVADDAADGYPEDDGHDEHRADNVVAQEVEDRVDGDVFYDVPEALYYVLDRLLADSLLGKEKTLFHLIIL
jgi:hypothetical protein